MRHKGILGLALAVALGFSAAGAATAGSKPADPPYAPDTWLRIETDHFIIYSDRPQEETFREVAAIEQFRFFMERMLPAAIQADPAPEAKLRLFMLKAQSELDMVRPGFGAYIGGVFFNCEEGQSAYSAHIPLPSYANKVYKEQDQSQLVVFHEYTHYLMARRGLNQFPMWYVEGLADYYSTLQYDGTHVAVGAVPFQNNLILNRLNWSGFDTVLAPDKDFSSGLATRGVLDMGIFYARAWLLTHYMMSDPDRRLQLDDYFARLRRGEDSRVAFKAATHIDPADMAGILRAYSKAMPMQITTVDDVPNISGDVETLEDSNEAFLYQAAVLDSCPSQKYGKVLLDSLKLQTDTARLRKLVDEEKSGRRHDANQFALNLVPQVQANPDYAMAVAYGEILYGDPEAPRATLSAITESDPRYARAQYLLGRSYLKAAEKAAPEQQAALRDQATPYLRRALAATPDDGPTHYFLAHSLDGATGHETEAFDHATTAVKLIPSVYEYGRYAALLMVAAGRRDEAVEMLGQFDNDPHDIERNKQVGDAITAIKAGKSVQEVQVLLKDEDDEDDDAKDKDKKKGKS